MPGKIVSYRTPFFLPWIYSSLVWRIPSSPKKIYLTFDDGPVHGPTEFVIDTLKTAAAKATFFCIGDNIHKHPDVFNSILQHDHAIGNHTFNHLNGWKTIKQKYIDNIALCEMEIKKHIPTFNHSSLLFRPPYGKITLRQIRELASYKIIMWDVLSMDFDKSISAEMSLRKTIQATRNGSIVVFHDSLKAEKKMTFMLPRIIDHFSAKGYTFEPIIL
jgi:peptidoglycan/xylan/chitin deacetylase (PgdA/CDA1 family)